ncbi:hypothetical protein GCM10022252_56760 [Streptosporangium oxazolinicum]|uniref:Uncharacterized protein n=1 Tax=Streptosporangium oxazolinicum TaxID=909287 RepID=A0ABP8BA65_9ACTN
MASVLLGRPEARTTRTASETSSPTSSPAPMGVTLNATSTDMYRPFPGSPRLSPRTLVSGRIGGQSGEAGEEEQG